MKTIAVVKIGGALLENPKAAAQRILAIGGDLVVVHGGGVQISRMLEKMNVKSQFIDGLRVTDAVTLSAVAAALAGQVQTSLVAALQDAGRAAVGTFGIVSAEKRSGPWGLVGTNVRAETSVLTALLEAGKTPVIPTLAIERGSLLNVNGDETAAAVAIALKARRLHFLTDVAGVLDEKGELIESVPRGLTLTDAPFVTGGMKPKLRSVQAALSGGVETVLVGGTVFGEPQ